MSHLHILNNNQADHHVKIQRGLFCYLQSETSTLGIYFDSYAFPFNDFNNEIEKWGKQHPSSTAKIIGFQHFFNDIETLLKKHKISLEKAVTREHVFEVQYHPQLRRLQVTKNSNSAEALKIKYQEEIETTKQEKIKVMVVDDSSTIRNLLQKIFSSDPHIEVVATVENPLDVCDLIKKHKPDVITLDIHMPHMDGLTLLNKYLPNYPIPTVMISSISMEEGPMVLSALESGAVDYIQKPTMEQLKIIAPLMIEKVKTARYAKVNFKKKKSVSTLKNMNQFNDKETIIAIGSSTGGTEALREVFSGLPNEIPPIVVVQHIPPVFSKAFADRLNTLFQFKVKEAEDGDTLVANQVLIAPGGKQMKIVKSGTHFCVQINDDAPVNRHKPSVDYMFHSLAQLQVPVLSVILTGMGADGAKGMKALKEKGALTIAQDEETSVVFGMPKEAIKQGCVDTVAPLDQIAQSMMLALQKKHKRSA